MECWIISGCSISVIEEECDQDHSLELLEGLCFDIENNYTPEEKQALSDAATRRLGYWLSEPDKDGYTPRSLLQPEQKAFLEAAIAGRFDGFEVNDE